MKGILITSAIIVFSLNANAQAFVEDFAAAVAEKDTLEQREILNRWKAEKPNDAALFTSLFNYYFNLSRNEIVKLTTESPDGEHLELLDSTNQVAGYMGSEIAYDQRLLDTALSKIQEGIDTYPDRLDMRFGKIYALGETKNWDSYTDEIINVVDRSAENENAWLWTNNEPKPDGKDFMLSVIQDYQLKLFHTGNDSLLLNMRKIANSILSYYPKQVKSLSNLSVTHLLLGEYDEGLAALLKAEQISPNDVIVLSNIAHGYKLKGDELKAIDTYKKIIQRGSPQDAERAQKEITRLRNE